MYSNLVGKRVYLKKLHARGIITSIINDKMKVDVHGTEFTFSYPSAFSTILELEDEDLQQSFERKGAVSEFEEFKRIYSFSLYNEIQYLKSTGGKHYQAIDGERIKSHRGTYTYAFDTDSELHFPDGTPIKIWLPDNVFPAIVVTCEDFTIMLNTPEYLGETVQSIEFTAEQWQLLESLKERIDDMTVSRNSIAYQIATKGRFLMDARTPIACGQPTALSKAENDAITFIWGPPGTGKTQTLANIVINYIEQGKRVLMLSYSNVSVDGALLRVAGKSDYEPGVIIRYGYPRVQELLDSNTLTSYQLALHQNPNLAKEYENLLNTKKKLKKKDPERIKINKWLGKIKDAVAEAEHKIIQEASFVATTVSKAVIDKAVYEQHFDLVIFDEASMAYVPQVIFAAGLAKTNFVCLGDFRQLPAIVQNREETNLERDIFEYTGITSAVENGYGHEWLVMLDTQYRMHPDIARFVSKYMYGNLLKTAPEIYEKRQPIADCEPLIGESMCFLDLSNMYSVCVKTMDGSRINLLSALMCARLAEQYIDKYEVGIITPYSAQSRLILAMIRDLQKKDKRFSKISCATVHQFQGSEKPVIIYDAVDCFRMPYPGTLLTSLRNDTANRLFNVALTRAQGKFILIANRDFLFRKNISKKLIFTQAIQNIYNNQAILKGNEAIYELIPYADENPEIYVDEQKYSWKLYLSDILSAKKEIHIEIPGMLEENASAIQQFSKALKKLSQSGIRITIRTTEEISLPPGWQPYKVEYAYVTNPITVIDKKIVWYGHPVSAAEFITEGTILPTQYFPCIRFGGEYTSRMLQAFLEL